ncbi:hypothetical protein DPMN_107136 [Dreissena polymorpha]|uniref:Uncharacterized protein n=1 Tax=Dreissena polymorpha TaxID=45954 RepID=A0A9D4QKL9_DREPO|nr:hypothetical protein DPMN_107136 [Dreissena polymorpha]
MKGRVRWVGIEDKVDRGEIKVGWGERMRWGRKKMMLRRMRWGDRENQVGGGERMRWVGRENELGGECGGGERIKRVGDQLVR